MYVIGCDKMTESRFQFLQGNFPGLFALCDEAGQAADAHAALLKARMALEHMAKDLGATQRDLFRNINELNDLGILDAKRSRLFHQVRRVSNLGVHEGNEIAAADRKSCLDALFEITLWYAISFKKRRYELAAFETSDMGLVKQYLSNEASEDGKPASAGAAQDIFLNSIDPLQIDGDFSRQMEKNQETDELTQDVFETDEEYARRIAAMPKVHLGYAILDARRQDGYTKIVFPLHHIDRNDRIHFSNNIRAFYAENITGHDVVDDELVGGLRVFDKKVYCNYSTIALKHGTEEIPMHPVCWEKFPYETERDLQDRMEKMPVLPLGLCMPDRNSYDIHTQLLTFAVKPFAYVKEKLTSPSIRLKLDRDVARNICAENRPYQIFGQLKGDKIAFILWDKELGVFYNELNIQLLQLGEKYLMGQGVPKDIRKGLEFYKKAAEMGSPEAQLALGDRYQQGIDVEQDDRQALYWYQKAAAQGNAAAQTEIGVLYEFGKGVMRDYRTAMAWYQKAAAQGNDFAQESIGMFYEWGKSVTRDYGKAMEWYQKAAAQGNAFAQNDIGELYYRGQGVKQDYKKAMEWYQKAAAQGNAAAQNSIGVLYETGKGVTRDYRKAMKWYQKASEQGLDAAKKNLAQLQEKLSKQKICFRR